MTERAGAHSATGAGVARVAAYAGVSVLPLIVVLAVSPRGAGGVVYELARSAALVVFAAACLQVLLGGRFRWVSWPFGLDMVFRFHRAMGLALVVLAVAHPVFLAAGKHGWELLYAVSTHDGPLPWQVWAGRGAAAALTVHVFLALGFERLGLDYERWRRWHNRVGVAFLGAAFVHSFAMPWAAERSDLGLGAMMVLWMVLAGSALAAYLQSKVLRPRQCLRHPYRVAEVRQETPSVYTVRMCPPEGRPPNQYLPGQFHFVTFYREHGPGPEEHHWTISSSPTEEGSVASTIKESGDFTRTIGLTRPGDRAAVYGPYGRFSCALHPGETELVFVAGGIGITPFRAMLRWLADTGAERDVLLLYANRDEESIAFREELDGLARGRAPRLRVVHILSDPSPAWEGETGLLDAEGLRRHVGEGPTSKAYYVCCPPPMARAVLSALQRFGVPGRQIHQEEFWL